jgi:hypothetical protein
MGGSKSHLSKCQMIGSVFKDVEKLEFHTSADGNVKF